MRVALNGLFWDQPNTGSGQYLHHLWEALHERNAHTAHPLDLHLLRPDHNDERRKTKGASKPPVPRHSSPVARHSEKLLWEQWGVTREAKRVGARLLHLPYLAAPIISRLPSVVTAHDMIPWVVPGYAGSLSFRLYIRLAVAGARRAKLIMADSEASRLDAIRVLRVPPSRVRTVYLGVEPPRSYTPDELESVRARYGLPRHFAFYIGGFDRRKNVPLLLGAWKEVIDSIMGGGTSGAPVLAIGGKVPEPGGINPDVRGEADALGLGQDGGPVRFLGYLPEEDKPLLMAAARVFAYPSAYEGFGLDPLEAMSLGTAVVSSWGGSLREVVGDGGLLVPPDDEAALARAILRAWGDDDLRRKLSTQGKAHAARFTWARTAEETARLYMLAVRGRKRVPAR